KRSELSRNDSLSSQTPSRFQEILVHLLDGLIAIHRNQFMILFVVIEQMNSLLKENIEPSFYCLAPIIGALVQRTSIYITHTKDFRRTGIYIIDMLVRATDVAPRETL